MTSRLKGGAIFLHVPKTGGTWVYAALERCGLLDPVQPCYHVHADMVRVMNRARFGHDREIGRAHV